MEAVPVKGTGRDDAGYLLHAGDGQHEKELEWKVL